ncbi:MAG: hypothetical protein N2Z20_05310, partial [Elusimicrobiales bacterium]|nr:hypothetical protein [Elusimicrobiales bacterium]
MFKKLLLDLRKTIYLLFAICTFSVIGSLIIHFNPEGYFKIHIYPLFQWLIEHPRLDTFWIYIIIALFLYIALATIFCLINDYKRRDLLVAIMHFSVLLFLAAHIVSALFTFRINDQIFIENTESKILIKEHQKVLNIRVKKIIYEISQFGIPVNIKAQIELPNG